MKQPPAGDFSDILAGLTEDGGPAASKTAPRPGRPAAPPRQAATAAPAGTAPQAAGTNRSAGKDDDLFEKVLRDRAHRDRKDWDLEDKDPEPAANARKSQAGGGRPQAGGRPRLRRLFPSFRWRRMIQFLLWRRTKPATEEKLKVKPEPPPKAADPAPQRPTSRLGRLFRAMPWPKQKGFFFSRRADPLDPAAGSSRTSRRDARAPEFRLPRTEDEAIAVELGLRADLASGDLRKIRREFAKKNHPDRIAAPQRMSAARRMSIANMLIDEHLKKQANSK